jgi:hypothetical protein
LIAGRAAPPLAAGESNKIFFSAIRTADTGEPLFYISALDELIDGRTDHRTPEAVLLLIPLRVNPLKRIKMIPHHLEKRRSRMVTGTVKPGLFDVLVLHNVFAEIAGDAYCSNGQYQVGKICSERRIFRDECHVVEKSSKKLLEQ